MKRIIIAIAIACAAITANAQTGLNASTINFTSPEPQRATERIAAVRLGNIWICRTYLNYGLLTYTQYGVPFTMNLGETKSQALSTMRDLLGMFDLEDGQSRTFTVDYLFEYRATKAGKNHIRIKERGCRGHIALTRNECRRLIARLEAYDPER